MLPLEQTKSLITVVLISDNTEAAYYQREEIAGAIHLSRTAGGKHLVVPVDVGSGKQITSSSTPYGLRVRHALSLKRPGGLAGVCKKLLRLRDDVKRELLKRQLPEARNPANAVSTDRDEWWIREPQRGGLLLARQSEVATIWDTSIRRVIGSHARLVHDSPDHFETLKSLIDVLSQEYAFVMLPLTLARYNSLRLAELAHRLSSPTRIVAVTSTEAPREIFEPLFDSFVPTSEFLVQSLRSAIMRAPRRDLPTDLIDLSIEKMLSTANCFATHHFHGDLRPTLSQYKDAIAGEVTEV